MNVRATPAVDAQFAARGVPALAVIAVALAATLCVSIGGASGPAAGAAGAGHALPQSDAPGEHGPPANATYEVVLEPRSPEEVRVDVELSYRARSDAELRRAGNGTLAPEWFRGAAIVEDALAARDDGGTVEATFHSSWAGSGDAERAVTIRHGARLTDLAAPDGERLVLGPGFAAALDRDDTIRIELARTRWRDWNVSADEPVQSNHAEDVYAWRVGAEPSPRAVLRREDHVGDEDDGSEDGVLAPSALLPLVALLAVAALTRRRTGAR